MSGLFAVRAKVLKELLADRVWRERLEKANSVREVKKVLVEFCRSHGYKVKFFS